MKFVLYGMVVLFILVCMIGLGVYLFIHLCPSIGRKPNHIKMEEYQRRTSLFYNHVFHNESKFQLFQKDNVDNSVLSQKKAKPDKNLPIKDPQLKKNINISDITVTWLGHSSFLIQMHQMNILVDPIVSKRCSPISFIGMKRFTPFPLSIDHLPLIDIVIITHDHYDHLDYQTICMLKDKTSHFIVPLGVENHLEKWHIDPEKISSLVWWEEITVNGLTFGCTPTLHFSRRSLNDQSSTLWASWVLKDEYHQVFVSGDGGFGPHFNKIANRYHSFDLALMECGQYDALWPDVHMQPEQSYHAAELLNVKKIIPIHWGAFQLAHHPWDDSVQRMVKASLKGQIDVITPMIGETVSLDQIDQYQKRWYEKMK